MCCEIIVQISISSSGGPNGVKVGCDDESCHKREFNDATFNHPQSIESRTHSVRLRFQIQSTALNTPEGLKKVLDADPMFIAARDLEVVHTKPAFGSFTCKLKHLVKVGSP